MITQSIERLDYLLAIIPARLHAIGADEMSRVPAPGKWSKKEIIGHLIDSAANNHQRFIRTQYQPLPDISYAQDEWVSLNAYRSVQAEDIINLWEAYNRQLLHLIKHIPAEKLDLLCKTGTDTTAPVSLGFLINDYVVHLEHHLRQLLNYE